MRLIRDGEKGGKGYGGGGRERLLYLPLHCHYQNDSLPLGLTGLEVQVQATHGPIHSPGHPFSAVIARYHKQRLAKGLVNIDSIPLLVSFLFEKVVVCGHCLVTLSLTINETLKWLSSLPIRVVVVVTV